MSAAAGGEGEAKRATFAELREGTARAPEATAETAEKEVEEDTAPADEPKRETFEEFKARRLAERQAMLEEQRRKSGGGRGGGGGGGGGRGAGGDGEAARRAVPSLVGAAVLIGAADWVYGEARAWLDRRATDKAVAAGAGGAAGPALPQGRTPVERVEALREVERLVGGEPRLSFVTGEPGAGKTSLVLRALSGDAAPEAGAVYVSVPPAADGASGADALAAEIERLTSAGAAAAGGRGVLASLRDRALGVPSPAAPPLSRSLDGLELAGRRAPAGAPTLVVDGADALDGATLASLLAFGERAAARGSLNVVVVGAAAYDRHARSGAGGLLPGLCEVGPLPAEQAAEALCDAGVGYGQAKELVRRVAGGNPALARAAAAEVAAGVSVDAVEARARAAAAAVLSDATPPQLAAARAALAAGDEGASAGSAAGLDAVLYRSPVTGRVRFRSPAARAAAAELLSE